MAGALIPLLITETAVRGCSGARRRTWLPAGPRVVRRALYGVWHPKKQPGLRAREASLVDEDFSLT